MIASRFVRLAPFLLPLLFISATCITDVRRHGTTGPWVGEVTNYDRSTIASVYMTGRIEDATGRTLQGVGVPVCPSQLAPGERGTFEVFPDGVYTPPGQPAPVPPYTFVPDPGIQAYPVDTQAPGDAHNGFTGEGLTTRLVSKDAVRRFALVELTNGSPFTYQNIVVCANLRTSTGSLAEVGSAMPFPNTLRPGESQTFPVFFNSMPDGTIEFIPRGANYCCSNGVKLTTGGFDVTATKLVDGGTALRVVGETHNNSGQTLNGTSLSAHAGESWADRADAVAVACGGVAPSGTAAPGAFTIPLASRPKQLTATIEGVEGYFGTNTYTPPVSDVASAEGARSASDLPTRHVAATISNPTTAWIVIDGACLSLRDARGRLVGTASIADTLPYNDRFLAPGAHLRVSADVEELEPSAMAEGAAYGQPTQQPAQPIAVPVVGFDGVGPENPSPPPDY